MRPKLLILVVTLCIVFASFAMFRNMQSSKMLDRSLIVKNWAVEGTSIGLAANWLREEHLTPIKEEELLRRCHEITRAQWKISTNSTGILFSKLGRSEE